MAGTLQAQHILSRVRNILQDNTGVRWTDGEMFDYLSDAQREVANFRPDSTALHNMGRRSRELALNYQWNHINEALVTDYRTVVSNVQADLN